MAHDTHTPTTSLGSQAHAALARFDIAHIDELATDLAQINRQGCGPYLRPISLAEHALLRAEILERQGIHDTAILQAALLADAHACVTGWVPPAVRAALGSTWDTIESRWAGIARAAFGLGPAFLAHGHLVWMAGEFASALERRDLLPPEHPDHPSQQPGHFVPPDWINLRDRDHMSWADWRQAWIDRWDDLHYAMEEPTA